MLAALARLNAELGTTVLLAEHRLERAAPLADRALVLDGGHVPPPAPVRETLADYPGAPSVTRLGRVLGWSPVPLTVREARTHADSNHLELFGHESGPQHRFVTKSAGEALVGARGITVELGGRAVLRDVSVEVCRGEVVVLLGRNGAGKTTLLRALAGLIDTTSGGVNGPARVAYVPQHPGSLLFAPTVRREVAETLHLLGRRDDHLVDAWLTRLAVAHLAERHPRSLAGGERQRVAIAAVAVGGAEVLGLDEPTRGMDAPSRTALEHAVREHAAGGGAVVLATHDVELAARCATRAIVLGDGDVVASGPARDVLAGSLFAPQVLRVLPPYLTVEEVEREVAPA